jgi:hypothetical protein
MVQNFRPQLRSNHLLLNSYGYDVLHKQKRAPLWNPLDFSGANDQVIEPGRIGNH